MPFIHCNFFIAFVLAQGLDARFRPFQDAGHSCQALVELTDLRQAHGLESVIRVAQPNPFSLRTNLIDDGKDTLRFLARHAPEKYVNNNACVKFFSVASPCPSAIKGRGRSRALFLPPSEEALKSAVV